MTDQPKALTTLNKIREHAPCPDGWEELLRHLGKTKADDEPLALATILDSNGIEDALWCLRAVSGWEREKRLYAVWCARQVQHLMADSRSLKALDVAERYANGQATDAELAAARDAAWDAAGDAAGGAAWAPARTAAGSAAWSADAADAADAAWDAARDAAWGAAWAPARTAAGGAAWSADAADAADAAWDAARDAAWSADAADAARAAQEVEFRRVFCGGRS